MQAFSGLALLLLLLLPLPNAVASFSAVMTGDFGGVNVWPYTIPNQIRNAHAIGVVAAARNITTGLLLGDNFYFFGISCVLDLNPACVATEHSHRFQETFERVYVAPSLQSPFTFHVVAGNHDHRGNVTAQIEYSHLSQRWSYPALYYDFVQTFQDPEGKATTVQFVMTDSVTLVGGCVPGPNDEPCAQPHLGGGFGSRGDVAAAEKQWAWLNATLAESEADWLVVAGHYPVWSISEHGPTDALVERLRPMLAEHGVAFYLHGHDHNLQHIREDNSATDHFDCGAGEWQDGSLRHEKSVPANASKFHTKEAGFCVLTFNSATSATMELVSKEQEVVYKYDKQKRALTSPGVLLPPPPRRAPAVDFSSM